MPQPTTAQAEAVMHVARTAAENVSFKKRAYSHAWLMERSLPSQLPDHMKPSAQRLYPVVVEGVGISVNFKSPLLREAGEEIQRAMGHAVEETFADGCHDSTVVTRRMGEARERATRALFGCALPMGA